MNNTLHVLGDTGENITEKEKTKRESERQAFLQRAPRSKAGSGKPELDMAREMLDTMDSQLTQMTSFDEGEYIKLKDRVSAGRALNMSESEALNELYARYA